jgi:ketosteroid isomerase-like protein
MKRTVALLTAPLLAIACVVHADPAAPNAVAEKQIRSALAGWVEAANRGDYKTAAAIWAPDLIGWAPEGPDDTFEREAAGAKLPVKPPSTTYALTINEVIIDGSLAVVRDNWTQTTRQSTGDKVSTFRSFEVWRRQPDHSWKISRWIDGPMLPGAASETKAK